MRFQRNFLVTEEKLNLTKNKLYIATIRALCFVKLCEREEKMVEYFSLIVCSIFYALVHDCIFHGGGEAAHSSTTILARNWEKGKSELGF